MFKWLNKQGVECIEKGFIVQCTGRFTSEYREGAKKIIVYFDIGTRNGKYCDIIKSTAFSKWEDGTPITQEKQKEILQNYIDAMEFQDMGVIVE